MNKPSCAHSLHSKAPSPWQLPCPKSPFPFCICSPLQKSSSKSSSWDRALAGSSPCFTALVHSWLFIHYLLKEIKTSRALKISDKRHYEIKDNSVSIQKQRFPVSRFLCPPCSILHLLWLHTNKNQQQQQLPLPTKWFPALRIAH